VRAARLNGSTGATGPMTITVRRLRAERQTIVDVTGALDAAAVRPLRRALARALRMRAPVLVDLTRATSLSRPALATLVAAYREAEQRGLSLLFRTEPPQIRAILAALEIPQDQPPP
jgi:anti-anti-sigma regulatory factor